MEEMCMNPWFWAMMAACAAAQLSFVITVGWKHAKLIKRNKELEIQRTQDPQSPSQTTP